MDRTPLIRHAAGGRYAAADSSCGGFALISASLLKRDLQHGEERTVDGRTIARIAADVVETPGQRVVHPIETPIKETGGQAILRGSLAPEGSIVKLAGHERRRHRGPARVFDSEVECFAAVRDRRIQPGDVVVIRYEGPVGGPGMQEMLSVTGALVGEGLGESVALLTDGRFSGGTARADAGARGAGGPPSAVRTRWVEDGDTVTVDVDARELNSRWTRPSWRSDRARWSPLPRATRAGRWRSTRHRSRLRPRARSRAARSSGPRSGRERHDDRRPMPPMTGPAVVPSHPGLVGFRISATESTGLDWPRVDEAWARAGEYTAISAGWMSDHLSDASRERHGPAFESIALAAALAHRVRGKWLGIAVLANTFRHPAVLAKSATVLDNVTGGRFVLGLGAGWHEGEHDAFGIPLPPLRERFDRYEGALRVLTALFSDEARHAPGVTLDDPLFPLRGATNEPGPLRPGGPPIWLGGQKPRGIALAVRYAEGWPMPGNRPGDVAYFAAKRDEISRALEAAGRDPAAFTFAAQLSCGTTPASRREALATARRFAAPGATVFLGVPAASCRTGSPGRGLSRRADGGGR